MIILLTSTVVLGFYILYKLILYYLEGNNNYWPKQGVPLALPSDFAAPFQILTGKLKLHELDLAYYNKYKGQDAPFVGIMEIRSPVILIRDLELIKRIYIKDFEHFVNRRTFSLGDELNDNFLFNMSNQAWKDLRSVISPTFTTGKIRNMFQHFDKIGVNLVEYITTENKKNNGSGDHGNKKGINLSELFGRYTMDVISSTAFGMESKCLQDDNSHFMKMGRKVQKCDFISTMKLLCLILVPNLTKWLRISVFDAEAMRFFKSIVKNTMQHRKREDDKNTRSGVSQYNNSYHDFLQLMMESRKEYENKNLYGETENDDTFENAQLRNTSKSAIKITDDAILANSLTFFLAGFDTTESLMSFVLYHLAIHPDMQDRLRDEILCCTQESDGKITYEAMNKMNYLEMFISEVLRLYPPATRTERKVTKPYSIPGTNVILPADMVVVIPIYGIHMDEKYYSEPKKFDPERFSPENKANRNPYAFMPFGHGPRNCIGMKFALFETKAAIALLVKTFTISPSAETSIPLKLENVNGNLKLANELEVAFSEFSQVKPARTSLHSNNVE